MEENLDISYFQIGIGVGFGLYCFFSLISYAIRELFKIMKM